MATRLSTNGRNAVSNSIIALVDADVGAGTIQVRTGAQPATGDTPATGTLLATLTLADPSAGAAVAGVATFDTTPTLTATIVATGTAGWFRVFDFSGDAVFDGAITATGGGGEMELATVSLTSGATLEITAGTLTAPATT